MSATARINRTFPAATALLAVTLPVIAEHAFEVDDGTVLVNNWMIQIRGLPGDDAGLRPRPIARAPHDLVIMDNGRFGDPATMFDTDQIDRIKHASLDWGGDGERKVVLANVTVGHAEDFRFFWDPAWTDDGTLDGTLTDAAPGWLDAVDPDAIDRRYTKFWRGGWQLNLFNDDATGWIDQVIAQGFDGVCLDSVDTMYYWVRERGILTELEAAQEMIDLIVSIAAHARQTNPKFLVFQRGAPKLLRIVGDDDPDRYTTFLNTINGVVAEDLYFQGDAAMNNRFRPLRCTLNHLRDDYELSGIPVFVAEYVDSDRKVTLFNAAAVARCFYPYPAPSRRLDSIAEPGFEPPCYLSSPEVDADLNDDDVVNVIDLLILLANWGTCETCDDSCTADLNDDCLVNREDLRLLHAVWHSH